MKEKRSSAGAESAVDANVVVARQQWLHGGKIQRDAGSRAKTVADTSGTPGRIRQTSAELPGVLADSHNGG